MLLLAQTQEAIHSIAPAAKSLAEGNVTYLLAVIAILLSIVSVYLFHSRDRVTEQLLKASSLLGQHVEAIKRNSEKIKEMKEEIGKVADKFSELETAQRISIMEHRAAIEACKEIQVLWRRQ